MSEKYQEKFELDLRLRDSGNNSAHYSCSQNDIELVRDYFGAEFRDLLRRSGGPTPSAIRVKLTLDCEVL